MAVPDLQRRDSVASLMTTASGARIETLALDLARAFLDRYGLAGYRPAPFDLAWGAFEDSGCLIGVGVVANVTLQGGRTWIAVAPERRRLGVGGELASLIVTAAQRRNLRHLTCRYRVDDPAPHHLAGSLELPLAHQVDGDGTWTVIALTRDEMGEMR
jgi:GNAT superfamily N-acetyltransferase